MGLNNILLLVMWLKSDRNFFSVIFLLLLLSFIAFGSSLDNGFLIDDYALIVHNTVIKSLKFVSAMFSRPFLMGYYRPVTLISFALDYSVWKLNPFGYHLTNILLHFLNSVLFFILLYLTLKDFTLSSLTGILFAVHPLNSVSVNYISDRGNLLVTFFILAALIIFYLGYNKGQIKFYVLGFLLFVYALLSRENAILFPFYFLCVFLFLCPRRNGKWITLIFILSLFIVLIYHLVRLKIMSLGLTIFSDIKMLFSFQSICSFFYMLVKYFSLAILPYNICLTRRIDVRAISGFKGILYICLILLLLLILAVKFRKNRIVWFALAWFFTGVLPLYNLMFWRLPMGLIMQDNWIYLSSVGLFIALSMFLLNLKNFINKRLWFLFIVAILIFYTERNIVNNAFWRDTKTYSAYWLNLTPQNYLVNCSLGDYFYIKNDYKKAKFYFQKAIDNLRIKDDSANTILVSTGLFTKIFNSLGRIAQREGNLEEAIAYFKKVININPNSTDANFYLGNIYLQKNDVEKAIFHFNKTIKKDFYYFYAHYNLSVAYARMGNYEKALEEAEIAYFLNPQYFKTLEAK
jgi:tetratricopeptide (TPR) repeat protein